MKNPDPQQCKWAVVGVKDETGVGRMTQDLKRLLNPSIMLVGPSYRHESKALEEGEFAVTDETPSADLFRAIENVDGVLFFEPFEWARKAVAEAKRAGKKVAFIVLWEWFRPYDPLWKLCDLLICPNRFAQKVLKKLGYKNTVVLDWPVALENLPHRSVSGHARHFVHNAGLLEPDDRKGTRLVVEAFEKTKNPDIRLTVRMQKDAGLRSDDPRIEIKVGHLPLYRDLYATGDVAVQPSKCEGLGFGILEAVASGMPLITTDYPPMNEVVSHPEMLVSTRWGKRPAEQSAYIGHAHFKIPKVDRLARAISWCAGNDLSRISQANRQWAEQTFDPDRLRRAWISSLNLGV